MKNPIGGFLFFLAGLVLVSTAPAGAVPVMEIMVENAANKEVYKGTTNANGSFATGELEPGNYVVQINSKNAAIKGSNFGIALAAGKVQVSSDTVPGQKIAGNGVALRVPIAARAKITGQVGPAGAGLGSKKMASAATGAKSAGGKIINGKRYIWVRPNASSLEGGHWVEEDATPEPASGSARPSNAPVRPAGGMHY